LQWKLANGISDKDFNETLKLIKKFLQEKNKLPTSTYKAKEIAYPVRLQVHKMHARHNECIMYRDEEINKLEVCPVCNTSWYKIRRDGPSDVKGKPPYKTNIY
jgi:hypothetical protein